MFGQYARFIAFYTVDNTLILICKTTEDWNRNIQTNKPHVREGGLVLKNMPQLRLVNNFTTPLRLTQQQCALDLMCGSMKSIKQCNRLVDSDIKSELKVVANKVCTWYVLTLSVVGVYTLSRLSAR